MADRLPVDSNVIGYWGFDESLETDPAFDESSYARNLTVTSASGIAIGRVGNARQFNGTSSFAAPADSSPFRLTGPLSFISWTRITNYNSGGSTLRTIVSCSGPTISDNLMYGLYVDLNGRVVYKHDSASGPVVVRTAVSSIRTGQTYSISFTRTNSGPNQVIDIYIDGVSKPLEVTVNGSPSVFPVPPPLSNPSSSFNIGRSLKETDLALLEGLIDEVSLHDTARSAQPYLLEAYFRIALSNDLSRLTYFDNILSISSYEMNAGVRWWAYERDKDIYVCKESPFGNFLPEVRLTTVGGGSASLTTRPELFYDEATDTLYVFFASGNRVFKLTAQSTDDPATINMPYTADTGSIIKSVDNVEAGRTGLGGGSNFEFPFATVDRQPVKLNFNEDSVSLGISGGEGIPEVDSPPVAPRIAFGQHPILGFGVVIGVSSSVGVTGFRLFETSGQVSRLMTSPVLMIADGRYFVSASPRLIGRTFTAETLGQFGIPSGKFSNTIRDLFTQATERDGVIVLGDSFDGQEVSLIGLGGTSQDNQELSYVNRTPVKFAFQEDGPSLGLGGGAAGSISSTGRGSVDL